MIDRTALKIMPFGMALVLAVCGPAEQQSEPVERLPSLRPGVRITVTQTVVGLGAGLRRWTQDDAGLKQVTVTELTPSNLTVEWTETVKEETEASRRRREAFERKAPKTGVGEPEPESPEPELEVRVKRGRVKAPGLDQSREITLPALWPEGDHAVDRGSLLWLSPPAFRELRSTRETRWRLGLMDSPWLQPVAGLAEIERGIAALRERLDGSESDRESFDRIEAEADFGSFELTIDGRRTSVRTIVARNWFAEYVIADAEDHPLILKVTLNPLSAGALDVFSPLGALKAVLGYQVLEVESGAGGG